MHEQPCLGTEAKKAAAPSLGHVHVHMNMYYVVTEHRLSEEAGIFATCGPGTLKPPTFSAPASA